MIQRDDYPMTAEGSCAYFADALGEQVDYYRLCDEARSLGIPTSLDDPRSPRTVADLREAVENARISTFDVWVDGVRTGDTVEAESLADAVRVLVDARGAASGFSPLGRRDVTPAGGDWMSRASCSCEIEDDGDGESGPHLSVVSASPTCDLHGDVR